MKKLEELSHAQRERLAFIDFSLNYFGEVSRADLIDKFQTGLAAATRDFSMYKELAPSNMELVHQTKSYHRKETFNPLFEHDSESILSRLSQGFGDGLSSAKELNQVCIDTTSLVNPASETISTVMRAITQKLVLVCEYVSVSSGCKKREIVPHAIVNNGKRWHVRAFDRETGSFRDFVVTRFKSVTIVREKPRSNEQKEVDKQWSRIVNIVLIPHPQLACSEAVELDYSMSNGELELEVRAAYLGYLLNYWSVDCTNEHSLEPHKYHLALKFNEALYDVESANLAPGYVQPTSRTQG
ncbi:helix-turn-helix transcriptional regulator [Vibrio lentus]|uniref:helix-turn-helix transcriptional regulator n=1 Tax=Vibrio lentus TaxID=136468 RepID=UPI0009755E52|nr:WYL domain-containing protein [Vibrio lentus]OMO20923.1 transcriptional regulator [Vibrio lentus]PMN11684.1 transcriptional regulator [Vibrio lentus]